MAEYNFNCQQECGGEEMKRIAKLLNCFIASIMVFQFLTIPLYPILTVSTVYAQPVRDQYYNEEPQAQEEEVQPYYDPAPFQETPEGEVIPLDDPEPYYPPPPPARRYNPAPAYEYQAPNEEENEVPAEESVPVAETYSDSPQEERESDSDPFAACLGILGEDICNQLYGVVEGPAVPEGWSAEEAVQPSEDSRGWWETATEWPAEAWEWVARTAEDTGQAAEEVIEDSGDYIASMFGGGEEDSDNSGAVQEAAGPQPQDPVWQAKIAEAQTDWDNYKNQALAEDPEAAAQTRERLASSLGLNPGTTDDQIIALLNSQSGELKVSGTTADLTVEIGVDDVCTVDTGCFPVSGDSPPQFDLLYNLTHIPGPVELGVRLLDGFLTNGAGGLVLDSSAQTAADNKVDETEKQLGVLKGLETAGVTEHISSDGTVDHAKAAQEYLRLFPEAATQVQPYLSAIGEAEKKGEAFRESSLSFATGGGSDGIANAIEAGEEWKNTAENLDELVFNRPEVWAVLKEDPSIYVPGDPDGNIDMAALARATRRYYQAEGNESGLRLANTTVESAEKAEGDYAAGVAQTGAVVLALGMGGASGGVVGALGNLYLPFGIDDAVAGAVNSRNASRIAEAVGDITPQRAPGTEEVTEVSEVAQVSTRSQENAPVKEYDWYDPRRWVGMKPESEPEIAKVEAPEELVQGGREVDPIRVEEPEIPEVAAPRAQEIEITAPRAQDTNVEAPAQAPAAVPNRAVDPNPEAEVPRVDEQAEVPAPRIEETPVEPETPTQIADAPTPIRPEEPNPTNVDLPCAAAVPSELRLMKEVYAQDGGRKPCNPLDPRDWGTIVGSWFGKTEPEDSKVPDAPVGNQADELATGSNIAEPTNLENLERLAPDQPVPGFQEGPLVIPGRIIVSEWLREATGDIHGPRILESVKKFLPDDVKAEVDAATSLSDKAQVVRRNIGTISPEDLAFISQTRSVSPVLDAVELTPSDYFSRQIISTGRFEDGARDATQQALKQVEDFGGFEDLGGLKSIVSELQGDGTKVISVKTGQGEFVARVKNSSVPADTAQQTLDQLGDLVPHNRIVPIDESGRVVVLSEKIKAGGPMTDSEAIDAARKLGEQGVIVDLNAGNFMKDANGRVRYVDQDAIDSALKSERLAPTTETTQRVETEIAAYQAGNRGTRFDEVNARVVEGPTAQSPDSVAVTKSDESVFDQYGQIKTSQKSNPVVAWVTEQYKILDDWRNFLVTGVRNGYWNDRLPGNQPVVNQGESLAALRQRLSNSVEVKIDDQGRVISEVPTNADEAMVKVGGDDASPPCDLSFVPFGFIEEAKAAGPCPLKVNGSSAKADPTYHTADDRFVKFSNGGVVLDGVSQEAKGSGSVAADIAAPILEKIKDIPREIDPNEAVKRMTVIFREADEAISNDRTSHVLSDGSTLGQRAVRGTTGTAVIVVHHNGQEFAVSVYVGDSPAYIRNGNALVELTPLALRPQIGNYLGASRNGNTPKVQSHIEILRPGEEIVITSDGISLDNMQIASIMAAHPDDSAAQMVRAAKAGGERDDATAVVVRPEMKNGAGLLQDINGRMQGWIDDNPRIVRVILGISIGAIAASGVIIPVSLITQMFKPRIAPAPAVGNNAEPEESETARALPEKEGVDEAPVLDEPPLAPAEAPSNGVPPIKSVAPAEEVEEAVIQLPVISDEAIVDSAKSSVEKRSTVIKSEGAGCGNDNNTIWIREFEDGYIEAVENYGKIPGQCGTPLPGGTCKAEVSDPYGQCGGTTGLQDKSAGVEYEITRTIACDTDGKPQVTYSSKEVGVKGYCPKPPTGEQGKPDLKKANEICNYNFECGSGLKCDSVSSKCLASHVFLKIEKVKDEPQFNFCGNLALSKKSDGAVFSCYDKGPYKDRKVQIKGVGYSEFCWLQIIDLGPGENCAAKP
jgi:serine/threonine protein phosphatase PrpC